MIVEKTVPTLNVLYNSLPADQRTGEVYKSLQYWYDVEVTNLDRYAREAQQPQIVMQLFRQAGNQSLAEFWVNDLAVIRGNSYNFHGQNVSQWKYAGAICVQDGQVSTHH